MPFGTHNQVLEQDSQEEVVAVRGSPGWHCYGCGGIRKYYSIYKQHLSRIADKAKGIAVVNRTVPAIVMKIQIEFVLESAGIMWLMQMFYLQWQRWKCPVRSPPAHAK